MKVFGKNPIENLERKLKTASIVFSMILTLGAASFAQSIDDVLKPKKPIAKPKAAVKTPAKTVKKSTSRRAKSSGTTAKTTNSQSVKKPIGTKTKPVNRSPGGTNIEPARRPPAETFSSETPNQILTRYMNFRESADVTDKDWNNVIFKTAKMLESDPNHKTAKAQSLMAQGQIAYNQRNYAMAVIHFKAALKISPESSVLHYSLGKAYLANGQAKAAENSFEEAVDQNKKFALAYKGIGEAAAAQGEKKKAEKYFKKATEISVKDDNMAP